MANAPSFGRRGVVRAPVRPRPVAAAPERSAAPAGEVAAAPAINFDDLKKPSADLELEEWKRGRKRVPIPWRQVYFMASICFGLASFILPDSINGPVDWALWGLAGVSFYIGITTRRRAKAEKKSAASDGL